MIKMVCNRAALDEAVGVVRPVVAARTPKPVLECVRLSAEKDSLTLMATDLEVTIRVEVTQVQVEQAGQAVISAGHFGEIVSKTTGDTLSISGEDTALVIASETARFHMLGMDPAEFPEVPDFEGKPDFTIAAGQLAIMINQTIFATAKEQTRYAINGVLWERSGKKLALVATDGRRLARATGSLLESSGKDKDAVAIVPVKALNAILRLLREPDEAVAVKFTETQMLFRTDRASVTAQLVEGQFPKYQDVVPRDCTRKAHLAVEEFRVALSQAAIQTSEESKGVRLSFSQEGLTMSAHSAEHGDASVRCRAEFEGEPLEIGFNPLYLLEALKVAPAETCTLELQEAAKPGLLKVGGDFLYVVMPVNLG